jgi:Tol biopolymer transport system component
VPGDANDALDVFVRDRRTGRTTRLLLPNGSPIPAGGRASQPSISADGAVVAFTYQPAAAAGTTGVIPGTIVLAWDRRSNDVEVVSRTVKGTAAPGSRQPSVSGDGRYVAFTSDHAGVVAGDRNASPDVFRYDRRRGTSVLASLIHPSPHPSSGRTRAARSSTRTRRAGYVRDTPPGGRSG